MVGEIRRGVCEVLDVEQVEQEGRADDAENRSEEFALERDRNQENERVVQIALMHPRREHEEAEERDENRQQRGASRSRAPDEIRRDQIDGAGQREAERAVRYGAEDLIGVGRAHPSDQSHEIERADRSLAESRAEILVYVENPIPR